MSPEPPATLASELRGHAVDFVVRGVRPRPSMLAGRAFFSSCVLGFFLLLSGAWMLAEIYVFGGLTGTLNGVPTTITAQNADAIFPLPQLLLGLGAFFALVVGLLWRVVLPPRPWFAGTKDALVVWRKGKIERHPWVEFEQVRDPMGGALHAILLVPTRRPTTWWERFKGVGAPFVISGIEDPHAVEAACRKRIQQARPNLP